MKSDITVSVIFSVKALLGTKIKEQVRILKLGYQFHNSGSFGGIFEVEVST